MLVLHSKNSRHVLTARYALCAAVDWRRTNEARHGLYQVISDTLGKLDVTYTMPAVLDGQGCAPSNVCIGIVYWQSLRSQKRWPVAHLRTHHTRDASPRSIITRAVS